MVRGIYLYRPNSFKMAMSNFKLKLGWLISRSFRSLSPAIVLIIPKE